MTLVEKMARAIDAALADGAEPTHENYYRLLESVAIAALKVMREPSEAGVIAGASAWVVECAAIDGPVKPHEDCKTIDDWMDRAAGLTRRMVSGREMTAAWQAMIDAAIQEHSTTPPRNAS